MPEDKAPFGCGLIVGIVAAALVFGGLTFMDHMAFRREAVKHGAAEYVCDPETGVAKFRWKENK